MATIISTSEAASPIGPYSQATQTLENPRFVFASGQIPLLPSGGLLHGTIAEETAQALRNVTAVLSAAKTGLDRIVKVAIYVTNMGDFNSLNEEYSKWFEGHTKPARSCIEVKGLPKGARVEIEVIAPA